MAPDRLDHGRGGIFSSRAKKADIIDDAVMLATGAVRSSVKNLLIVRALRDGKDFDEAWWLDAVAREFEVIAVEKEMDAARVEEDRQHARGRHGRALHPADFRATDVPKLKRRLKVLREIAARLRAVAAEPEVLRGIIADARASALDEIASARHDPGREADPDPKARKTALKLLKGDLADLLAERTGDE